MSENEHEYHNEDMDVNFDEGDDEGITPNKVRK